MDHRHTRSCLVEDVPTIEEARGLPRLEDRDIRGTCGNGPRYGQLAIASRAVVQFEAGTATVTMDGKPHTSALTIGGVEHHRAYDMTRLEGTTVQELRTARAACHLEALYEDAQGRDVALIRGRSLGDLEERLLSENPESHLGAQLRAHNEARLARVGYNHRNPNAGRLF